MSKPTKKQIDAEIGELKRVSKLVPARTEFVFTAKTLRSGPMEDVACIFTWTK